jgi:hypothetical protein
MAAPFHRLAEIGGGADFGAASVLTHATTAGMLMSSIFGLLGYLPIVITSCAGFMALLVYLITFWESQTVRNWVETRQARKRARKIARLQAKQKVLVAELEAIEKLRAAKVEAREKVQTAKSEAAIMAATQDVEAAARALHEH